VRVLRLLAVAWWFQWRLRSRSAFDGLLTLIWPIFFSTTILLLYQVGDPSSTELFAAALGSSVLGVWSATSMTAAGALQEERQQGTLELLVATPAPLPVVLTAVTMSMATIGAFSFVATLAWGRLVFGVDVDVASWPGFLAGISAVVVAVGALGFLLAVSAVRYRSSWAIGSALEMPVWLIGGFVVPLELLPEWVRPLSYALAPTWGMRALSDATRGSAWTGDVLVCLGITLLYFGLGALLARRLVRGARKHASLSLS
jgi:ABC-2 type transport system permease protein